MRRHCAFWFASFNLVVYLAAAQPTALNASTPAGVPFAPPQESNSTCIGKCQGMTYWLNSCASAIARGSDAFVCKSCPRPLTNIFFSIAYIEGEACLLCADGNSGCFSSRLANYYCCGCECVSNIWCRSPQNALFLSSLQFGCRPLHGLFKLRFMRSGCCWRSKI